MTRKKQRCLATTKAGHPCKAWAVAGSDPPRCDRHGGPQPADAAPPENAVTSDPGEQAGSDPGAQAGVPGSITSLDDAIDHLTENLEQLAAFIREHQDELTVYELARVCEVRGQNVSRFARLLRERAAQAGELDGELAAQIDEALDLAGETLKVEV
jgi:hypothetical protein